LFSDLFSYHIWLTLNPIKNDFFYRQVLKEELSKSMTSLVKSGRVSVSTVDKGDNVMVVWNEEHK
jgi:hypothetical protein